jgi:flagellar M-ring protein FliF
MPAFLKQLKDIWGRLKPGQRLTLAGAGAATIALIGALIYYGSQPEYGVLFSDLKPADAQTIVEKLKSSNVKYQLSNGGTTLSVPQERISELRLEMASSGVLSGGHVGFDLFDKTSFGTTDFTQQVNFRRAVEGELARTIEGMDEVESARLHITQPRESIFADKAERAKASVMIRVRQGRELSRERTEAITNLVASAVEALDPQDISVMDTQGRVLSSAERAGAANGSGAFSSQIEARRKFEAESAARIVSLIEPISGVGHVRADVAADLDFSQVEQMEEKYDPKSQVIRSQQTTQEVRNLPANSAATVVGARANDPAIPAATPAPLPAASPSNDQRMATTTNYEIDKIVRRTTGGSGRISRMSVSVLVDYKKVEGIATVRTPEELQKIQEVVAAAVGIDPNRGDQIVIQSIPFDQPTVETKNPGWLEKNNELVRTGTKYGAILLAALLLIIFVIRPARRALAQAANPQLQLAGARGATLALPPGSGETSGEMDNEDAQGMSVPDLTTPRTVAELEAEMEAKITREINTISSEAVRSSALRKQLAERAKNNPEAIAMTLRGWLQEKKTS